MPKHSSVIHHEVVWGRILQLWKVQSSEHWVLVLGSRSDWALDNKWGFYLFTDKQTQFPILYTKILQFKGHYVVLEKKIKLNFDINNIK